MDKEKKLGKMKDFVVIGLGRFGKSVATELYMMGNEVLAIDKNSQTVMSIDGKVSTAVTADATAKEVLYSLGVQNFDCAIVCVGDDLEGSLLIVQMCKELDVKYIIAKAKSESHGKILYALGVDMVVFPENFAGKKLANMLAIRGINELVDLTGDFKIFEMPLPDVWNDKSIRDINMTKKYKISIVFIKRGREVISPEPETVLKNGDELVLAGFANKISSLASLINTSEDVSQSLKDVFGTE